MTSADQEQAGSGTYSCNHVTDDNPCPARVLYERVYQQDLPDLYGWMRFHHGWHARDTEQAGSGDGTTILDLDHEYYAAWGIRPERCQHCGLTELQCVRNRGRRLTAELARARETTNAVTLAMESVQLEYRQALADLARARERIAEREREAVERESRLSAKLGRVTDSAAFGQRELDRTRADLERVTAERDDHALRAAYTALLARATQAEAERDAALAVVEAARKDAAEADQELFVNKALAIYDHALAALDATRKATDRGWLCPHREHSTGECGPMCECTERIRNGTYGRPDATRKATGEQVESQTAKIERLADELWIAVDNYLENDSTHNWEEMYSANESLGEVLGKPKSIGADAAEGGQG